MILKNVCIIWHHQYTTKWPHTIRHPKQTNSEHTNVHLQNLQSTNLNCLFCKNKQSLFFSFFWWIESKTFCLNRKDNKRNRNFSKMCLSISYFANPNINVTSKKKNLSRNTTATLYMLVSILEVQAPAEANRLNEKWILWRGRNFWGAR